MRQKLLTVRLAEHLANTGHVVRLSAARPARKRLVSRVNSLYRRDNRTCPNFRSRLCLPLSVRMKAAIEGERPYCSRGRSSQRGLTRPSPGQAA